MSDMDLVVRLPIYQKDGGAPTGAAVEIPLPLLRRMVVPIKVFDLDMRIVEAD
jgi:hypothetical protein